MWGIGLQIGVLLKSGGTSSELVICHAALIIYAANAVLESSSVKGVIDSFSRIANGRIYRHLSSERPDFPQVYESRLKQYFPIFTQQQPALGLSFALMRNLGLDPLANQSGQLWLVSYLTDSLKETTTDMATWSVPERPKVSDWKAEAALKGVTTVKASAAVDELMQATEQWSPRPKAMALTILAAALNGDTKVVAVLIQNLSPAEASVVRRSIDQLAV